MSSFVLLYARETVCSPKENNQIYLKHKITNFDSEGFTVFYSCAVLCCALQSAQLWHPLSLDPWTRSGNFLLNRWNLKKSHSQSKLTGQTGVPCVQFISTGMYFIYNTLKRKFLHLVLRLWLIFNIFCLSLAAFTNLLSQGDWGMILCSFNFAFNSWISALRSVLKISKMQSTNAQSNHHVTL